MRRNCALARIGLERAVATRESAHPGSAPDALAVSPLSVAGSFTKLSDPYSVAFALQLLFLTQ